MPILNYTTTISAAKTAAEIMDMLRKHGVRKIVIDFDDDGQPNALTFQIDWMGIPTAYALPARHEGVLRMLKKDRVAGKYQTTEQARRVAWRIVKDWVAAQMAIVSAHVASLPEVFLPYAVTKNGDTAFTVFDQSERARQQFLLN